jgi:transcriptional regulator with XRE-family HTH domain
MPHSGIVTIDDPTSPSRQYEANNIKDYGFSGRTTRKWSQEDLAKRLGVAAETISRFERGATLPSLITLQRVSQILKAPIAELLTESSHSPDDQAAVISAWISPLHEDEREYVLGLVKGACDHLRRKR